MEAEASIDTARDGDRGVLEWVGTHLPGRRPVGLDDLVEIVTA